MKTDFDLCRAVAGTSSWCPGNGETMTTNNCCAECGIAGGVSLKTCKQCMQVRYCNANCQKKHWATHKKECKLRAAELRDEALFKDPPPKEDCSICFIPMPMRLICCISLPPATVSSVPIYDFSIANEELVKWAMACLYSCCGKSICGGCAYSFGMSGNDERCPFCNSDRSGKTDEELVVELMNRIEANDVGAIRQVGCYYDHGERGFQQDQTKAMGLYARAADLGCSESHYLLADIYYEGGDMKKAKFHNEAAAMAGDEVARYNLGNIERESGNMERALKHWTIAASAGYFVAMHNLLLALKRGYVSRESIDTTLTAYNNSCTEMRSEARDAYFNKVLIKIENEA